LETEVYKPFYFYMYKIANGFWFCWQTTLGYTKPKHFNLILMRFYLFQQIFFTI